jgi:hypothetical protein
MIHCATENKAGLVIVTRDTDYGATIDNEAFINDALRQEFSDRVSRKRDLLLYSRLSDALKFFDVKVTKQEEASEAELLSDNRPAYISKLFMDPAQRAYLATVGAAGLTENGLGTWKDQMKRMIIVSQHQVDEILGNLPKADSPEEEK